MVDAVREITPDRPFTIDGMNGGDYPHIESLIMGPKNLIYSTRGYRPTGLTHYKFNPDYTKTPVWPNSDSKWILGDNRDRTYDRSDYEKFYGLYAAISSIYKVGVICGEFGCANYTPHEVVLAWLEDLLSVLKEYNIGWAMWNLRGVFGVFDSNRADVDYENYRGYKLDRKMMNILQKY